MQHEPWVGSNYAVGLDGQKVLIVGFSHWGELEKDNPMITKEVVSAWARGEENVPFCPRIRSYFGDVDPSTFWHSVAFANTLPTLVGEADQRYAEGTKEQRDAIPDRAYGLIEQLKPDRIFVFSRRAWSLWPHYTGSLQNGALLVDEGGEFDAGSYSHEDGEAIAFGFPHPQFTPVEPTKRAVAAALKATVDTLRPTNDHI
ncbi:hypothetical protein [Sphingomonas sp.]|uniref:hypothetical protein n=1 Tax=Sphingomonas sp. TaxID=28214 RepID=UPI0035C7F070